MILKELKENQAAELQKLRERQKNRMHALETQHASETRQMQERHAKSIELFERMNIIQEKKS